jgi:hypothetical protein
MEPAESLSPSPAATWHGAVTKFKRRLLEQALRTAGGNRTRAARALGLQRTYLLRLIREFGVAVPPVRREAAKAGGRGNAVAMAVLPRPLSQSRIGSVPAGVR